MAKGTYTIEEFLKLDIYDKTFLGVVMEKEIEIERKKWESLWKQ